MSPSPRRSLHSFLARARAAVRAPAGRRPSPLTFVVGNESADLDSLCCALVYAFLRSRPGSARLHVPLANLPRADLALRPEMAAVLAHAGLRPADLITLSDLPAAADEDHDSPLLPADTRWVLVDHNALTGPLARFAPHVVGCIDHHVDEGAVPRDAVPRVIEPCGSCMSLVVDETRPAWDAWTRPDDKDPDEDTDDDPDDARDALARLALAPILIDTVNLGTADKVKAKDMRAVPFLEAMLRPSRPYSRQAFFDELEAVKKDISGLSFRDVLRKDYKQWSDAGLVLGVSCVVQGLAYLVDDKAAGDARTLLRHLDAWAHERQLDVAALMTTSHPRGCFQRHLLVWGRSPRGSDAVASFARQNSDALGLRPWRDGELDCGPPETLRRAWRQDDLTASRKRIGPLLREAMKDTA